MKFIEKNYKYIVAFLLIIMLTLEITSSLQESQTIDEGVHLSAGYSYLVKNDYRMNTEHPPLIKQLSALPLLFYRDKIDSAFDQDAWNNYDQWKFAKDLIYYNGNNIADKLFFLGRFPIMLLSLLLGFYVFKWSKELFGTKIALFVLLLYTFAPNIIAHSRYVTTDIALTTFFFITIYYFNKYLKSEKYKYFIYMSIFFGLAQATKFSAVILIPIILILGLIMIVVKIDKYKLKKLIKIFTKNVLILFIITFVIIFASYKFEIKKPIDDINVQSLYTQQEDILANRNLDEFNETERKIIEFTDPETSSGGKIKYLAENLSIPAFSYLNGLTKLMVHNYYGHMSYLLGEHSNFGWWYYFIIAFLVKTPTTILLFIIILIIFGLKKLYRLIKNTKNEQLNYHPLLFLIFPPLFYFIFSLTSNINLGLRHILPIYPFIFVISGYLFILIKDKFSKIILYVLMIFYICSSILIFPHYLAYFNEISGGPNNGTKYLVDSNIDWGQDVKKLKKYMNNNNIEYICSSYFGQAEFKYYGIDFRYLPNNNDPSLIKKINCVVAISATSLYSKDGKFSWLSKYEPDYKIGYSIFIYDMTK